MLRGDDILGVIVLYKREVQPFTDKQIGLVETFAAQAGPPSRTCDGPAELQEKNRAPRKHTRRSTESLEQTDRQAEICGTIPASR